MHYFTEAIVLKSNPYGEADLIVTYFTKNYGLLNLFAKSPRKIKSRFGSSLEPLTYSRISFIGREERLQRIIQSDIIHSFQKIREDYRLFLKAAEGLKLINRIMPKREPNSELFSILLKTLFSIEKTQKPGNYILFLKTKTLDILGYLPDFKHCGVCKTQLNNQCYYFKGFIVCETCFGNMQTGNEQIDSSSMIALGVKKLMNEITKWKFDFLERVKISSKLMEEVEKFLSNHLEIVLEKDYGLKNIDSLPLSDETMLK
ncbi:DNA repair protein RecO [Thermodesulfovibrio hydrogeniphilus]